MDFLGKDKLSRLDEERQRRRQQRAEEALRRLEEVGKQTQQLVANHTTATQNSASEATDQSGRRPGGLSRVLFETATGGNEGRKKAKNKLDPRNLMTEAEKGLAKIDGAMATIRGSVVDAAGAGLKGGLEEASKSVTDVMDRVTSLASGTIGTLSPSANKNPLQQLMAEEQDEEHASRHEAKTEEHEDHKSRISLEHKLDNMKNLAEKATGLHLGGEKRGGDDDEGGFQFQSQLQGILPHEAMHAVQQGASVNLRELAANAATTAIAAGDKGEKDGPFASIKENAIQFAGDLAGGASLKEAGASFAGNVSGDQISKVIGGKAGDVVGGAASTLISDAIQGEKSKLGDVIAGGAEALNPLAGFMNVGGVVNNAVEHMQHAASMKPGDLLHEAKHALVENPVEKINSITEKVGALDPNQAISNIGAALDPTNFAKLAGTMNPATLVGIAGKAMEDISSRLNSVAEQLNPNAQRADQLEVKDASGQATGKRQHMPSAMPSAEHPAGDPNAKAPIEGKDGAGHTGAASNATAKGKAGEHDAAHAKDAHGAKDLGKAGEHAAAHKDAAHAKDAGKAGEKGAAHATDGKHAAADGKHAEKDAKHAADGKHADAKHAAAHGAHEATHAAHDAANKHGEHANAKTASATAAGEAAAKSANVAASSANPTGVAPPQKAPQPGAHTAPQSNKPAHERIAAAQPTKTANATGRNASPVTGSAGGPMQINAQPVMSPAAQDVAQNAKEVTQPNVTIHAEGQSAALPGMPADLAQQTPPTNAPQAGTPSAQTATPTSSTTPTSNRQVTPLPQVTPAPTQATKQATPTNVTMPQVAAGHTAAAASGPQLASSPTPQTKVTSGATTQGAQSVPAAAKAAPPPPAAQLPKQNMVPSTAAPQTPSTPAPQPNIPPVRTPGGDGAPNPSGMVEQTANLGADRSNAAQQMTAEAQTASKVGPEASTQKQAQVASQKPAFEQTKRSGDAPRQQAVTSSTTQGQQATEQGKSRGHQTGASANAQIAAQAQSAAAEKTAEAQKAASQAAGVMQQSSPAVMKSATGPAQAQVTSAATAAQSTPVVVNPSAIARAGQAASTPSQLPPFDAARFNQIDQHPTMPETSMAAADASKQAAEQTYQQANQQIEQLTNIQPPQINAPVSPNAGKVGKDGKPTRESAIANIEQQVTSQAQGQGPAKMQEAARPLQQEVKQHTTSAQQAATTSADTQLQQHQAKSQQIKQQPAPITGAQAAAQAQPQYQAHQAEATAAQAGMQAQISSAQTAANASTQQAKQARDQQLAQAQAQYQQQSAGAQGEYASAQQAAKGNFDSQNQAAQSAMAADQQQAQAAAQQQTAAAQAKNDADIAQQHAQLASQQQQANASHQQQMEAANQQHEAQVQAAQAQMDSDVSSKQSEMQSQVASEQQRGQQEVDQHLTEGEQGYQREIQSGEQQANAEKARAEQEARAKEQEAQAQKDKGGGGIFGKVAGWVKDRFNDLMNAAKAVLAAARDLIVSIMEKARQAAIAVLNKARQAALAALAKVKSAIQGIISACASAIRSIISACAQMVRNLIQNLANMLKSLVQALTTLLTTLVQAFQAAVNALLDGLIAAVSLINKDLGDKLRSATQKYRDAFNNAMNSLQSNIKAAGDALQAKIQQAADGAIAVVNAAEQTLNNAVTRVEQTLNAAVETAYQVGAAAINKAFDAAEAVVNKAFEVAETAVKMYFDAQIAALDLVQQGVNAVADFVVAVADKVLSAVAKIAEAIVNMIPESWTKAFVDFWNGPWRQAIIIGLATVAAVAITVATCGAAGPVAMILVAGVIGGTLAGGAYFGGELLAREGEIKLSEDPSKGIYIPGIGYQQVKLGPDGKPVMPDGLTEEQQAAWAKNSQWALSNFNTQKDAEGNVTGYDRKSSSEIANYAVQEGVKGFGEGFISAAGAMGGSLAGGAVAGLGVLGRVASNPIARQMIASAVEAGVGVVSQSTGAAWTAGFDAIAEGKSPGEAFKAAWKAGSEQITDPGNWVSALASVGVVPLKTKALGPLLDKVTGRVANQAVKTAIKEGTDVVVDTMAETVGNAGGSFVSTYYKAIQEGKTPAQAMEEAKKAANDAFSPEQIIQSLAMNTAGNIANKHAERYAANKAAQNGGTPPHADPTPDGRSHAVGADGGAPAVKPHHDSDGGGATPQKPQHDSPDGQPRSTRGGDETNATPRTTESDSTEAQRQKPPAGQQADAPDVHSDQTTQKPKPVADTKPSETPQHQPTQHDATPVKTDDTTATTKQPHPDAPAKTQEPTTERFQDRKTDQARIDQQMAEKGHSGIEVHSHFMGNVEPSSFAATLAKSGDAPMRHADPGGATASQRVGDHSVYEPVMREIAALSDFKHQTTTGPNGEVIITQRGRSGDAIAQIEAAQARIETLKQQLETGKDTLSPADRKRIEHEIHEEARSSVEKALRASDETDFNSSYEVRDELVKKFYGAAERNEILTAAGVDPKSAKMTDPKVVEAYAKHFEGREEILARIPEAAEAERRLAAGDFKDKGERKALEKKANSIKEQMAYDQYAKETLLRLAQDGITYTEQSNSINKIGARFDEGQIDWLKAQLLKEHANDPKMVKAISDLQVKHVTMINTNMFGVRGDEHMGAGSQVKTDDLHPAAKTTRASNEEFTGAVKQLVEQTRRGDVVGVDIAGAEHFTFDKEGQRRMTELYDALAAETKNPSGTKPIVLRPHVGEGANDVIPGMPGHRDANRQIVDGPNGPELSHYARAKENLDSMLKVFEAIAARPENGGKLPPDVIVRFGHATHTTPEMAARMARLGIIAEVNLTSNIETGSVSQAKPHDLGGKQDNVHKAGDKPVPYETDPKKRGGSLDDHAFTSLIAADAPVILSTDAHSVMNTNMGNEYARAKTLIEEVRGGKRKVAIDESIIDPEHGTPGKVRSLAYDEMPQHLKDRFDRAERKLYEDANRYYDMRPKQGGDDGPPPPSGPGPVKPKPDDAPTSTGLGTSDKGLTDKPPPTAIHDGQAPSAIRAPNTDAEKVASKQLNQSTDLLRQKFGDRIADYDTTLVPPPDGRPVLQQSPSDALIGLPAHVIPSDLSGADALVKLQQEGIPRWGGLTAKERAHETAFASHVEANLPAAIEQFTKRSLDDKVGTYIFEVDGAKKLYEAYGAGKGPANPQELDVRASANHALHPAAVAVARVAFLDRLDALAKLPEGDPQRAIFVTNGGCAAGKGSLSEIVKGKNKGKFEFGAVWDAAGEGDAQENAWILKAAQARGLKVSYGFVENDPMFTYNAVLDRADKSGRIVDPVTFARSYVRGQENMKAFLESPEYKEAAASGQADALGVYTGKWDTKTESYPDSRLLGDQGAIGAEHMPKALDESGVTSKAIDIFEKWLAKREGEGKATDHWFEGGVINPLKFGDQPHAAMPETTHAPEVHQPGVGKPPTGEAADQVMRDFREVNGDHGRGKPPTGDAADQVMRDFREVNGDHGRGKPPTGEAADRVMDDFREVNGDHGRGKPPTGEAADRVMDDFREVNGDHGRGKPPTGEAADRVMDDFREVNGDHGRGKPPTGAAADQVMEDFRQVNGDQGRGKPPTGEAADQVMRDFREVNGDAHTAVDGKAGATHEKQVAQGAIDNMQHGGAAHDVAAKDHAKPAAQAPAAHEAAKESPEPTVTKKPNDKLGHGGGHFGTVVEHGKHGVDRFGSNLDALDIGPDPQQPKPEHVPADTSTASTSPVEVGVPGVTLPTMQPKGPRPKITAKHGQGDWHSGQKQGAAEAHEQVQHRKDAAMHQGEATTHAAGDMVHSHLGADHDKASSLTAAANKAPQLVAKRGGGRKQPAHEAKQPATAHDVPATKTVEPANTNTAKKPEQQQTAKLPPQKMAELAQKVDTAVDAVKDKLGAIAEPLAPTFAGALEGKVTHADIVKKVADPRTRAQAAVKNVPADKKSAVLGRLDAVAGAPPAQVKQFTDAMNAKTEAAATEKANASEAVGEKAAEHGTHKDFVKKVGIPLVLGATEIAASYLQHNKADHDSLKQIKDQAFQDLATSPQQILQKPQPDLRDPNVLAADDGIEAKALAPYENEEEKKDEDETAQPKDNREVLAIPQQAPQRPQPQQPPQQETQVAPPQQQPAMAPQQPGATQDPHQTVAKAQQAANKTAAGQAARTQQHEQHAQNREEQAKQRAAARKSQADQAKQQREAAMEKEAPAQKAKMKAELQQHQDLAIQALTMNKEQLAAEYDKRLGDDLKVLKDEITKAKTDVQKTWDEQKPKVEEAFKQANVDIDKFCNAELANTDKQLKTLSTQLKGNKEQAAKTAEEQGKNDCDRYADTRDGNIEKIKASAQEASEEQKRLGTEAYNIAMARANRATDEDAKNNAKKDADSQKAHFDQQAAKCITDGDSKAAAEKKKYDDLIAKRTESYKTTAKNIREKGVGYLDEMKQSFEQAKLDIEKLRVDSKAQAVERRAYDMDRIQKEINEEMKRLDLRLEEREIQLRQEIKYALNSMANLTDDQKKRMVENIQRATKEACARIDTAKANELGAMQLQLADCHAQIDQTLGALGSHTAKAVRQLAAFRTEFSDQVKGTVETIKSRGEQAIAAQQQIAQNAKTTSANIRSGAMDSVKGKSADELSKRDVWSDVKSTKEAFENQKKADAQRDLERAAEMGRIGKANHNKATEAKVSDARRKMGEAIGGWGVNPDMGAVMRELSKMTPEEIEKLWDGPEGKKLKERFDSLSSPGIFMGPTIAPQDMERIQQMMKAGTPEEVKANVIDWSFNGGFTGAGYDDATFKEVMKGLSPEERAEIDRAYKGRTGHTIEQEIDDEAWFSKQNNKLMKANLKSDAAAIAEESYQAAEGGFFRGVKDMVDAVPGGRFLSDPGGEIMRGVGPMFGFKAPDHPLDTLAGYGMNQDEYIRQRDRIRELTEPPPGASAAEVSSYLTKRRDMMREIDGWLGANHNGLTLEQLDNSEANSDYNKLWMKNNDATTFRNMLEAGRTGDWAKYSNNKAAYGAETTLGNRAWLKQEIDYRQGRGDLKGLRDFLGSRSEDGNFESFIDANIPQAVDRGYFKSIAQDPPPSKGSPEWKQQMANRLLYAQFGGRTGWGDDRAELEKVIGSLSKEELEGVRAEYSKLSGQYGLTMDNDQNKVQMLTNPVGFFFLGNWSAGNLDKDMYLSYGGYMSDLTGGVIGKGRDYAMVEYDLKHGKAQTIEEMMARERYKRDFDMSSGMFNAMRELGIYDSRGFAGEFADERYKQLETEYAKLKAAGVADISLEDPRIASLSPETIAQIAQFQIKKEEAEAWAKSGNANTRAIVDGMVTVVTTTVTIITTAAVTILTAGTATPFLVAALMAAGGAAMAGLAGMGVKVVMLGNAYGGNEAKMDFANTVIDALAQGITAGTGIAKFAEKVVGKLGIGSKLAQELLENLLQNAINTGADMTKFLLDENLYTGSPEEVIAKIRKRSLQSVANVALSTAAGVNKQSGAFVQTTIQSAVMYDPDQPAWGQFLNYASALASAVGSEMATKWGTSVSEHHWGEGGMMGPTKGKGNEHHDAPQPQNGMRRRPDGTIEVTSPQIADSIAQEVKKGNGTVVDGNPPRYRMNTPNGPIEVVVVHPSVKPNEEGGPTTTKKTEPHVDEQNPTQVKEPKPVVDETTTKTKPVVDEQTPTVKQTKPEVTGDETTTKTQKPVDEAALQQRKQVEEHLVEKRTKQIVEENPGIDPKIAERRARLEVDAFGHHVTSEVGPQKNPTERAKSQQDAGHGQIEAHSHFMGNVEPDVILKRLQDAGQAGGNAETMQKPNPNGASPGDRVGDVSTYEPLLREIAKLRNLTDQGGETTLAHTYKDASPEAQMKGQKYEIDPETGQPVIAKRGTAGDALNHVETVLQRIEGYKEMLLDPKLSPADREYIRQCIHEEAQSAVNKALRASNETDFNSSYEIRDELIKKWYGDGERSKILGDAAKQDLPAQLDKYREHFADRPRIAKQIEEAAALHEQLQNPDLKGKEREAVEAKLAQKRKSIEEQVSYDAYAKDTILRLAKDDIRYTEQSNSLKKMKERFDPEQLEHLKRQLAKEHPELADKIWALEIKHVAMITTNNFGERDVNVDDIKQVGIDRPAREKFNKQVDDLVEMVRRGDVAGVDIAGVEWFRFDAEGGERMKQLHMALMEEAKAQGKKIVLRPHVGEGANDPTTGKHFARDMDRQVNSEGELTGPARARHNVDQMLKTFEAVAKMYGSDRLPPEITVRFGHATHATPEMAARMAKLGIIAEVNLASNVQTGASPQTKPEGGVDAKRGRQEVLEPHNPNLRGHGNMDEHSLTSLIAQGVDIILSTDSHEVMSTDMKDQYDRAGQVVKDVIDGKRKVEVVIGDPPNHRVESQFYKDMDPQTKARFDRAQEKFYQDANHYYDKRRGGTDFDPSNGEGGSKLTTDAMVEHVKKLHEQANDPKSSPEIKKRAEAELKRRAEDPEWAFASAKAVQDAKNPNAAIEHMSGDIPGLLAAQDKARLGKNPELQAKREVFEREVAKEVLNPKSEIAQKVNADLDKMCAKAIDYIMQTRGAEADFGKLGTPTEKGYGGGLGDDHALMLEVLQKGNIRERMLALGKFTEMLAGDVMGKQRRYLESVAAGKETAGAFTAEDAQALVDRARLYERQQPRKDKQSVKEFMKPLAVEGVEGGKHAAYADAKAQDMDTKLPPLVAEKVAKFLNETEGTSGLEKQGEDNRLARTGDMTVKEAIDKGLQLSQREIDAAGGLDAPLNWVVGQRANIVDPNAPFIAAAKDASMPLKAGISGTTFRWMQTVELLGGNAELGRLAAVASLQGADAHSWHEIAFAAQGYGLAYDPSNPYANMGISEGRLRELAEKAGVNLDDIKSNPPPTKPTGGGGPTAQTTSTALKSPTGGSGTPATKPTTSSKKTKNNGGGGGPTTTKQTSAESNTPAPAPTKKTDATEGQASQLRQAHEKHTAQGDKVSEIFYDPTTKTASFDVVSSDGTKTRVDAKVDHVGSFDGLATAKNAVVGKPVDGATAMAVLEKLNRGDTSALREIGIADANGALPHGVEFGLGQLADGRVVVVIGEPSAVDWAHLPGMTPIAHTHPSTKGNDLPKNMDGERSIPLKDIMTDTPDPLLARELVYPSGADFIVMAHQGVAGHVVITEFVVKDGVVMKAQPGEGGDRLNFTIVKSEQVGSTPDGRAVYRAEVIGSQGKDTPIHHEVWVVADPDGTGGHLFMKKPANVELHAPTETGATKTNATVRSGDPDAEELEHFEQGHFTNPTDGSTPRLEGGGHSADNMAELRGRGFEELTSAEVIALRAKQKPFEDAHKDWDTKSRAENRWFKARKAFADSLGSEREFGPLKNPKLDPAIRDPLLLKKAARDAQIADWESKNPPPPKAGREPKPKDFGIDPKDLLSDRRYFYHDKLGTTDAEIGGVSSTNSIHEDGHTWFPPGWEAKPIMALLESGAPGITAKPMTNDAGVTTGTKFTAWIKQKSDGTFEIAPSSVADPAAAGYVKSSMIVPASGAQRSVFPEMHQTK